MIIWIPDLTAKAGPKFKAIADAIENDIAAGALPQGARLPPQRELAYALDVSLNTVTRAYAEALRRGLVRGEVGRGTYVKPADWPDLTTILTPDLGRPETGPIDLSPNLPCLGNGSAPLSDTLTTLSGSGMLDSFLDYQPEAARGRHEAAGAAWLARLGLEPDSRDVILTSGAQHGILVSLMALLRPGDTLLVEQLTYAPLRQMAHHLNLKLVPVEMDGEGIVPEALERAFETTDARALYCMPTLHTPTTATMPEARRRDIAEIVRGQARFLIEDAVYSFLPRQAIMPLSAYVPTHSIFVTSVSKCLAPGLRVGYLVAPERLRAAIRNAVSMTCWMTPPLMAEIASRWIEKGTAARMTAWQRAEANARQQIAGTLLAGFSYRADPDAFSLWLELPEQWRATAFREEAERHGVKVLSAESFAVGQAASPQAVRISLGYETSRARVTRGLEIIAALLAGHEAPGPSQI